MVVDVCFRKECRKSEYMLIVARTDIRINSHISESQLGKKAPTELQKHPSHDISVLQI